jgi:nucleotidyltransferase/DNA polymerase involved in DNA repair
MTAFGYLYMQGLPFAQSGTMLPSSGQLRGSLPQAVLRRGLIFDVNRAAATAGVMLGSPLSQARQTCPDLISAPLVEAVYEEALRPFIAALRQETHRFELDGPNSLFIDFSGSGEPVGVLQRLLDAYRGFSIVSGIGSSKFLARAAVLAAMASHTHSRHPMYLPKPAPVERLLTAGGADSQAGAGMPGKCDKPTLRLVDLLTDGPQASRRFLAALPVGYLWPASEEKRERLYRLGLKTCGELAAVDRRELGRAFGPDGGYLAELATGRDTQGVRASYTPDEIVRRIDFDGPLAGKVALQRAASLLGEDLGRALVDEGLGCRTLSLTLHWSQGGSATVARAFSRPRGEIAAISSATLSLLDRFSPQDEVLGVEVAAQGIERACGEQVSFLARAVGQSGPDSLLRTLSTLERRFPGGAVRLGPPPVSRRELMLQLVDPMRWQERSRAGAGATVG